MKYFTLAALLAVCGLTAAWFSFRGTEQAATNVVAAESDVAAESNAKRPVLVELFTSEGCSSCPPADRLLTALTNERNSDVITLAFHVDYWNYLGWKDRFSSPAFSRRQEEYARQFKLNSSYTPQMVVDGSLEFVGSNRAKANETIAESAVEPKATVQLGLVAGKLTADILGLMSRSEATIYLAVAESKLLTKVSGGENRGEMLEHTSVVRELVKIGKVKPGERNAKIATNVPANAEWNSENVKYVVFVQENEGLKVLAVGAVR